jgi:uncharacterized membrane protein YhhN
MTALAVLVLLFAEHRKLGVLRWASKPVAAVGFVLAGLAEGATSSDYGWAVLVALVLSFAGDILLIPKSKKAFLFGIVAFLLAHVAYVVAFFQRGTSVSTGLVALVLLTVPAALVGRKILPRVPGGLEVPVLAYMAVISTMVAFAIGTRETMIIAAAVIFYLSDLCVARERFIDNGFINKLFGLPLYFGAQLIFAATIAP